MYPKDCVYTFTKTFSPTMFPTICVTMPVESYILYSPMVH